MRKFVAQSIFKPLIGKKVSVMIDGVLTSKAFSGLYSANEWMWGENHASLKSSLNAGYKVVGLGGYIIYSGIVHLYYGDDKIVWSDHRMELLVDLSLFAANNSINVSFVLNENDDYVRKKVEPAFAPLLVTKICMILKDLDLS